jgi:hypothetical protein
VKTALKEAVVEVQAKQCMVSNRVLGEMVSRKKQPAKK